MHFRNEEMNYTILLLQKTFFNSWFAKLCGGLLVTLLAAQEYFLPIASFIKLSAILVAADWLTGILASVINGVPLTSVRMKRTVIKITGYSIALIVAHEVSLTLLNGFQATYFATFYIASTELKSLDENMEKLFGFSILGFLSKQVDQKTDQKEESNEEH